MKKPRSKLVIHFLAAFLSASAGFFSGAHAGAEDILSAQAANTTFTIVPEVESVAPGSTFRIGFLVELEDHWHTYWKNPGDSGFPVTIEWQLPDGVEVSEPVWPYPRRLDLPPLTSYGYEGSMFLLFNVSVPAALTVGETLTLEAKGNWLSCRIECVPGTGTFRKTLPVKDRADPNPVFNDLYEKNKQRYPIGRHAWDVRVGASDGGYVIQLSGAGQEIVDADFYPDEPGVIDHAAAQELTGTAGGYQMRVPASPTAAGHPERLSGLLVVTPVNGEPYSFAIHPPVTSASVGGPMSDTMSLPLALLFAFLGGIILNAMPCVLPVLSIKVLSLVDSIHKEPSKTFINGLKFTLGILVSFWFLALFIVLLKSAGAYVGWGFQFQSPVFIVFMAVLFFWLGLNLFGVFEVGTSLTRIENFVGNSFLLKNHFVNGILATVVATPCTAPFMGSAMGYALLKPPVYAYLIFTFLGLGLASPYLILSANPKMLKFIPKPGPWMLVLKKIFGFLFMATVVWLAWVLGAQRGATATSYLYAGLLTIAVSAWIIGRWATFGQSNAVRWRARLIAVVLFVTGFGVALQGTNAEPTRVGEVTEGAIKWQPYTSELIDELRAAKKPVFIDFTAKWCLSCQVNDRVALAHPDVIKAFEEKGVAMVQADWTNYDERITKALAALGKNSVPVYILYGRDAEQPIFLPEILTPRIVLDALKDI